MSGDPSLVLVEIRKILYKGRFLEFRKYHSIADFYIEIARKLMYMHINEFSLESMKVKVVYMVYYLKLRTEKNNYFSSCSKF